MADRSRRLVLLDRDGVINRDSPSYIKSVAEWEPLPGSLDAIARLTGAGIDVVVVTNQSGIGRGLLDTATLNAIHAHMIERVAEAGGRIAGIYYCPHRPDQGCDCRKPQPRLLLDAARDFGVDIADVVFIGDKASDLEAALAAGAQLVLIGDPVQVGADSGIEHHPDLAAAAQRLVRSRKRG